MGRSLQDDLRADAVRITNDTSQFAVEVQYRPQNGADFIPLVGLWHVIGPVTVEMQRGKETVVQAQLITTSDATIEVEGVISVNNESWVVKTVGREMMGQRIIQCQATNRIHSNGHGMR